MKKVKLVFVPGASPTCIPHGIASLFAYIKMTIEDIDISMLDLSVHFWNQLSNSENHPPGSAHLPFQDIHRFFDRDMYTGEWQQVSLIYGKWQQVCQSVCASLQLSPKDIPGWYDATLFDALNPLESDIFALSAAYPEQLVHAALVARLIKQRNPDATVVLGGSALPAIQPRTLLDAVPQIDFLYLGEGEQGIVDFLQHNDVRGRGWTGYVNGELISGRRPMAIPMQSLPAPSFSTLGLSQYWMPAPVIPVAFSRGCRWRKCAFCSHNFGFAGYRTDDFARFVSHLSHLHSTHGARYFYFTDQYIDATSLSGIASEILKQNLSVRFHVMGRPTSDYTREMLTLLFTAGCRWISWGVESGAQSLLNGCHKGTHVADVAEVLKNSHLAGINNLAMMVFGLPGTTESRFQQTLDFAESVSEWVDAFTDSSFQLFEQTPYFRNAASIGIVPEDNEVLFSVGTRAVLSNRRAYLQRNELGELCPPAGPNEVALWKRWKTWVRNESFFETLPAEHYLLYADRSSKAPL